VTNAPEISPEFTLPVSSEDPDEDFPIRDLENEGVTQVVTKMAISPRKNRQELTIPQFP
jgi:hypothetical protein